VGNSYTQTTVCNSAKQSDQQQQIVNVAHTIDGVLSSPLGPHSS